MFLFIRRPWGARPHPPFPLVSSASFGSARSRPGREAAKRTLDGNKRLTPYRDGPDKRTDPPFSLVNSASLQIGPQRSRALRAKRPLDGEDRSGIIQGEGEGGGCRRDWRNGAFSAAPGGCSEPSRRDK